MSRASYSRNCHQAPYTGSFLQMALTFSRTASITASLFRSARMSQIQPASSLHSASLKPRVVTAGVPKRRPEVTNGERGSFGTEFLFTVMNALPRAASASLPEISCLISDSRNRWFLVPPETTFDEHFGHGLGVFHHLLLVGLELRLQRFLEADRFGGDHVLQWATLGS